MNATLKKELKKKNKSGVSAYICMILIIMNQKQFS